MGLPGIPGRQGFPGALGDKGDMGIPGHFLSRHYKFIELSRSICTALSCYCQHTTQFLDWDLFFSIRRLIFTPPFA